MGVLLAVLAAADALGPWGLLALTFAIGAGTARELPRLGGDHAGAGAARGPGAAPSR